MHGPNQRPKLMFSKPKSILWGTCYNNSSITWQKTYVHLNYAHEQKTYIIPLLAANNAHEQKTKLGIRRLIKAKPKFVKLI